MTKITALWQTQKQQIIASKIIVEITNLWQSWNEKQQIYAIAFAIVVFLVLLILLLYAPLKTSNNNLNTQLQMQNDIAQRLEYAQTKSLVFSVVKPQNAKSVVTKVAKRYGLKVALKSKDEQLTLQAKAQDFNALSDFLFSLRDKYAIVATQAVINKIKDGIVDANLVLSLP